ncbi:MAG: polyprenol monophosphomannose synthase [Nitrospira sp.]|nr:polyprenol monophosphomannose synthase [Nitrospira sp.]
MRYHLIHALEDIPDHIHPKPDEAFMVPSFEFAEALIARGADSACIAVTPHLPSNETCSDYVWNSPNGPLIPRTAFQFDQPVLVVLPTYNERPNIEAVVQSIGSYLAADILIVDDNSPDGTGQIADELSRRHSHIHVLHRSRKEGLGSAYVAGFHWALARHYQLVIEMDCDFSHAPWDLPRLVYQGAAADLVIGSRYIPGGDTENWDMRRRLVSKLGNAYVRLFLGSAIRDWTGGFRCFRRELLAKMDLASIRAKGYVFQVEMAWRAIRLKARVREIPIRFRDRAYGHSKLGWSTIYEAVREVPQMSWRRFASK